MKKFILLFSIFLSLSLLSKSQIISGDIGFASNATPQFSFAPVMNVQYHLKNGDYVGMGILYDWARQRETYVVRYGTDLNKRWYLNSGVGFVNDYSGPNKPDGSHNTFRTYIVGVDYVFPKVYPEHPVNFYVGFDFTDEKIYLKGGVKFGHEKRKKK